MPVGSEVCVVAEGLYASYGEGVQRVPVLVDAGFSIRADRVTAIRGPSGSGKTTLLSLIGGLDVPEAGRLWVAGAELTSLSTSDVAAFRRAHVGFVFQAFHLLPTLTVRENVEAGLEPLRLGRRATRSAAADALDRVGLGGKGGRFPHELSGGEQQRVAIARACAKKPRLLIADEPTGNLDGEAAVSVVDLIVGSPDLGERPRTVIIATHDDDVAARADVVLVVSDHRVRPARESAAAEPPLAGGG
jgi:putative ABC transport system ATP-binding protein